MVLSNLRFSKLKPIEVGGLKEEAGVSMSSMIKTSANKSCVNLHSYAHIEDDSSGRARRISALDIEPVVLR